MSFNIDKTTKEMLDAVCGVVSGDGLSDCVRSALDREKAAIADIAQARLDDDIDDEEMKSQLDDEKIVLEAALLACRVEVKVEAQNAANAALGVLKDAIRAAI